MHLSRRKLSRKNLHTGFRGQKFRHFESLESRQLLNAAPMANDDQYSVLQDTVLSVNNQAPYPSPASFPGLQETQSIPINYTASQIEYSQPYNLLFVREGSTKIHVIDTKTGNEISVQSPRAQFVDLDLTADGKYLYVSDYGGTNIGYGTPSSPSYVHRFDVAAREWIVKQAPLVAYRIEGVDAEHFLLQEIDQHVDMMLNHFGSTPSAPTTELSRIRADYYGDFEYDHRTGRVYHGSTGSSSQEIVVRAIVDDRLVSREETGVYGSAQGGGPGSVLSTDGQYFFYGRLQVAASSVRTNIRTLPEAIHASTAGLAFGDGKYYSAETGASMGQLGYSTTVYGVSDHVGAVWTFDATAKRLRNYDIPHYPLFGVLINDTDADQDRLTVELVEGPQHGELTLNANGSFVYAPDAGFSGADSFKYRATDTADLSNVATVTLTVRPLNSVPGAVNDHYRVEYQTPLSVAQPPVNPFTYQAPSEIASIAAPFQVSQVEFAQHPGLLFVRESASQIRIIDVASGLEIDRHSAKEAFTDLDLSPSGRYLYVADFGGEVTGHGTPVRPSWVHRYDTVTRQWEVKQAPMIAYRIEAVDDRRFLLLESDQWVELTLNSFGATPAAPISELNRGYFSLYSGDIEYDHRTKLVYHGNTGISSPEIAVLKVEGDTLKLDHRTSTYGSAQSGSLPLSLSADGKRLFYGRLQVSSTDVRQNQFLHPRAILASTAGIAFSNDNIYSAETGEAMATLGYPATLVTASEEGIHLITHDGMVGRLIRIYQAAPLGWGVLANDTDAERDPLSANLVSGPAHGTLVFNSDGTFQYTPSQGFYGSDSFTYRASDGLGNSNVATVNLTVASLPPSAKGESYTLIEDGTLEVAAAKGLLINDSDPEAQTLTAVVVEGPRNGKLTLNEDGSFQYVPRANFFGSDSFTYQASDGVSKSAATIVNLTVAGTPDAPVGVADSYTGKEDWKLPGNPSVFANDVDADGDKLTATVLTRPANGFLHFPDDGQFTYVPNANFTGTDQFTYSINDGTSQSAPITVTLTITPVNDAPAAKNDSYATDEDVPLTIAAGAGVLANDFDIDGDTLSAKMITLPAHGTINFSAEGSFVYTPRANFNGTDSFTYYANDGDAGQHATVSITVRPAPDAPRVTTDTFTILEDQTLTVTLAGSVLKNDMDIDGGVLTAFVLDPPAAGQLVFRSDGTFVYTPSPNFFGHDSFTYRATNGSLASNMAQVGITITSVNDVPVAGDDNYLVGGSLTVGPGEGVLADDRDVDNANLTASLVSGPQHGELTLNPNGSFTYIPGPGFLFRDSFTYLASDGTAQSNVATVRIEASLSVFSTNVTLTSSEEGPVQGFFDVFVRVAPNAVLSTPGYEVSLGVPAGSGIELVGAILAPESPLFAQQSPTFSIVDNQLLVTDVSANGAVALQDGVRLFRVAFSAIPEAVGTIPLLFDAEFTNLSDSKGAPLPLAPPRGGSITVIDGITPKVESVLVGGAAWSASFREYLAAQGLGSVGYDVSGNLVEHELLPWTNLDRISIRFSEDVDVDREDLRLLGIKQASYSFADMKYDAASQTATWSLSTPIAADKLMLTLSSNEAGGVRDRSGNLLDGNPAPDATGDYQLRFDVLPGDVDQDGMTNVLDTVKTRNLQFTRAGDARYSPLYDVDGSASIGIFDTIQVRNNQFTGFTAGQSEAGGALPPPPPAVRITTESVTITSQPDEPVEGVLNVFVEVLAGADVSVAGYDVALSTPAESGVTLLSDGLVSAAYPALFASEPIDFKFPRMLGVTDTLPAGTTQLAAKAGLFSMRFAVAPGSVGDVPLAFNSSFTNLADENGEPIPVELSAGVISITQPLTTITGTDGDDHYHVIRAGSQLLIYENTPAVGQPKYTSEIAALGPSLTINALGGNDSLVVDSGDQTTLGLEQLIFDAGAGDNTLTLSHGSARIDAIAAGSTLNTTVKSGAHLSTNRLSQNGLSIAENGRVTLLPDGGTSVITGLSLATGATLDIGNSALVLDYSGQSPVELVRDRIISGRTRAGLGEGLWTGTGITSSAAAAANAVESESRAVGYAENALLPLGPYTSYRGVPVDDTALLITFTRTGDANLDGWVNDEDVTILSATYNPVTPNPQWAQADFDYNGVIDDGDVTVMGVFYDPESGGFDQAFNSAAVPQQKAGDDALLDLLATAVSSDHSRQFRESAARDWIGANAAFESLEDWLPIARRKVVL